MVEAGQDNKGNGVMIHLPRGSTRRFNGGSYIPEETVIELLSGNGYELTPKPPTYSPMRLKSHDPERHISVGDAYELLQAQEDLYLSRDKLDAAINEGKIRVYEFKGEQFLDRLDIGRVYHQVPETKQGLTIDRYFSTKGKDPLDSVKYERRDLEIAKYDENGNKIGTVFEMKDAEIPESWSEQAGVIVGQKYFFNPYDASWKEKLREKLGRDHEYSPKHLISRVTNFLTDTGWNLGYFETEEDRETFRDELKWLQINQRFAFNSPVQFNAGIFNEYGIEGSESGYWGFIRDPETGKLTKLENREYINPQCHACFIKGPRDNLESILDHTKDEGAVFASGSGIGQEIGVLRGEGEPLSGGGKASGPISFLTILDDGAGTIKSGGKSRRAARMTTMRYYRPDIMKFIQSKVREDWKAKVLMENGVEGGMDGEAVRTVTLQNTNLSVRLDDNFFEQLGNGGNVELRYVKSGEVASIVSAERMLKEIAYGSWRVGDPAVQYESLIQEMHTAKNSGRINSSNPCSEYMFLDDTSCNLLSHNLLMYTDQEGNFDVEKFRKAIRLSTIASDIINDSASYPIEDIAMISPEFRTIGVGYANLGGLLMRRGLAYDSEEGKALAGAVTALMTGATYEASTDIAEKMGTFIHFEFNKQPMLEVMEKHQKSLEDVLWKHVPENLKEAAYGSWSNVIKRGKEVGFRNAQATVLAPTGTISYLMDCYDFTGVEPGYSLVTVKKLAGGGEITVANQGVPNALKNLGYDEEQIRDITEYIAEETFPTFPKSRNTVIGAPHLNPDHYDIFATAVGNKKGIGAIPFEGHVRMLGATQPFISGAISKTNNLPESATVKDIYDGYLLGHELGLKAIAVFRSNSKSTTAMGSEVMFDMLKRGEKEDLERRRLAAEWEVDISTDEGITPFHLIVSEYEDGRPGQIAFLAYKEGGTMKALLSTHGTSASKALKRGVALEDIANAWLGQDFKPQGIIIGHPYIKTALSPLDFAAKILFLEYLGKTEMAQEPEKVQIETLRGFESGAFRTYARMDVDDWNVDQVLKDPELGGFVKINGDGKLRIPKNGINKSSDRGKNSRGNLCGVCGNLLRQTNPGCWSCDNCVTNVGGCGP